jgi:hypothetical protein
MVRFLLSLTLLLTLLRSEYVQANCYAGAWSNGMPVYGSLFVDGGTTLAQCQAIACQIYPSIQGCPNTAPPPQVITCTYSAQTETRSCPVNYSGSQTWKKETNCPTGSYGQPVQSDWFKIQDTCVQNPPTCQVSSQQQTLSCQTGYTGSITQTRSSMCPNPYGSPVWQPWVTTSDTCKKSVNNPTNPVSPVNPASPVSQPTTTSAPTIQSSPVTVSTPNSVPNSETTPTEAAPVETAPTETQPQASTATTQQSATATTASPTTSTTQATPTPAPKGKTQSVVGLVLSLELFVKPGLQQPNVFSEPQLVGGIPNNILMQDSIMMDLLQQKGFNQPAYNQDLGFEQ